MGITAKLEQAVLALRDLPAERQDGLAEVLLGAALPTIDYSDEQLTGLDDAIASADRGEFATEAEVSAVFGRFRKV